MALGRRAAADHGLQPRHAGEAAPLRRAAGRRGPRRARLRHRLRPQADPEGDPRDAPQTHDLPLFEVPYEMPFIAITERAAAKLVNEQFDALERGAQVHERLERLVIEGGGLEQILAATAAAVGGSVRVVDRSGGRARSQRRPTASADDEALAELARELAGPRHRRGAGRARGGRARRPRARGPGSRAPRGRRRRLARRGLRARPARRLRAPLHRARRRSSSGSS